MERATLQANDKMMQNPEIAKSVAEAKQFCTTDLDDFDDEEDDLEDFFE
jgi:hypothetical protein